MLPSCLRPSPGNVIVRIEADCAHLLKAPFCLLERFSEEKFLPRRFLHWFQMIGTLFIGLIWLQIFVFQTTMSSLTTDTTDFSSSQCSPNYPVRLYEDAYTTGSLCSISLDQLQVNGGGGLLAAAATSGTKFNSFERKGRQQNRQITRHISIDDQPITHTYHQNSLEDSSETSHCTSEVEYCLKY